MDNNSSCHNLNKIMKEEVNICMPAQYLRFYKSSKRKLKSLIQQANDPVTYLKANLHRFLLNSIFCHNWYIFMYVCIIQIHTREVQLNSSRKNCMILFITNIAGWKLVASPEFRASAII